LKRLLLRLIKALLKIKKNYLLTIKVTNTMTFQFAEDFKKLTIQCPPSQYKPENRVAYRWVFDEINDPENFKPVYYKDPIRALKFSEEAQCQSLALSFFASEEQAKDRFNELKETIHNANKQLGTMVAESTINEQDGVNSKIDRRGHFSHHPVVGHEYEKRFVIISKL
jgi:hypothetical protein